MPTEVPTAPHPGAVSRLLPPQVAVFETRGDLWSPAQFPVEDAAINGAVESRRREFRTGRTCARRALGALGLPDAGDLAIPRGASGEPVWPRDVVGSLTHCAGYRAAAVAWSWEASPSGITGIGIDAEPAVPLPPEVLPLVTDPPERRQIALLRDADPDLPWDRLLFSAKESLYKARYPITRQWLDFSDVRVTLDLRGGFFAEVRLSTQGLPSVMPGRWAVASGITATAVVLAAAR